MKNKGPILNTATKMIVQLGLEPPMLDVVRVLQQRGQPTVHTSYLSMSALEEHRLPIY